MSIKSFKLVEKNNLAPEIFELSFESEENLTIKH
jgi:hypothetical protein